VWGREAVLTTPDKKEKKLKYDAKALTMMIMGPREGVVKGFEPMMPAYADQLTPDELKQILDFLEHGDSAAAADGPEAGKALANAQGCLGCHSTDGSEIVGPSFKGLLGKKSTAKDGAPVDRAFVTAVLKDPAARLGRVSSMPAYPALTETEREALLKYLESLSAAPPAGHDMTHDMVAHDMAGHDMKNGEHK